MSDLIRKHFDGIFFIKKIAGFTRLCHYRHLGSNFSSGKSKEFNSSAH